MFLSYSAIIFHHCSPSLISGIKKSQAFLSIGIQDLHLKPISSTHQHLSRIIFSSFKSFRGAGKSNSGKLAEECCYGFLSIMVKKAAKHQQRTVHGRLFLPSFHGAPRRQAHHKETLRWNGPWIHLTITTKLEQLRCHSHRFKPSPWSSLQHTANVNQVAAARREWWS